MIMSILSLSSKIVRRSVRTSLFLLVMFQVVCIGGVCLCNAVEVDCDQLLSNEALGNNTPHDEETGVVSSPEASEDISPDTESVQEERKGGVGVVYQLTEEDVGELTDTGVPDGVIESLKDLQDIEYENDNLFKKALVVKDDLLIVNYADKFKTYKLTEQFFTLLTDAGILVDIINELRELQDKEYSNRDTLVTAVETKIKEATGEYRALIVEKARKEHEYDTSKSINWSGGSCGCSPDTFTVVYGFYPFWMAGTEQILDFSVLSRIGYFALSFNEKGMITDTFHWKKDKPHADFINVAHRYRTKVDLVIYNRNWKKWHTMTSHERLNTIDTLTTNIVNLATIKLTNYWSNAEALHILWVQSGANHGRRRYY